MDRQLAQLPNIAYAWTTAQLHASMAWLDTELDRRGDVAFAGMDTRGKVHAKVGARLFTITEELNLAVPRLKTYWSENRQPDDPKKSPAFTGLGATAFAGRQVRMHLVLIGQMLTAEATGSRDSSVRTNCGIMLLAKYGQRSWRIMAEDIPMPPPSDVVGRVQVVTAGRAREAQVPQMDEVLARQMVLDGVISPLPYDMPCQPRQMAVTGAPVLVGAGLSPAAETVSVTPLEPRLVGLKAAAESGELGPGTTLGALRMARHRREKTGFPEPVERGREDMFDLAELIQWDAARR
jgi:hypothetical protein